MQKPGQRRRIRWYTRGLCERMTDGGDITGWPDHSRYETTVSLASADESLYFSANISFWAWWGGVGQAPPALQDIARTGITQRAEHISARYRLTAAERMQAELNTELMHWKPAAVSQLQARGHCISLAVDPDLVAAVEEHEQATRQHVVLSWREQRRKQELEQMSALLLDPLRATAWWLLDNRDNPAEAVTIAQKFQELRTILQPEEQLDSAGTLVDELLATVDESVHASMVQILRRCFHEYQRADLAARLPTSVE